MRICSTNGISSEDKEERILRLDQNLRMRNRCISRESPANGNKNQTDGAPDGGVGPIARTKDTRIAVDINLFSNRPVDEERRTYITGRRLHPIKIEPRLNHRLY